MTKAALKSYLQILPVKVILPAALTVLLFVTAIFLLILPLMKATMMDRKREVIQELAQTAWSALAVFEAGVQSGRLSRQGAQRQAIEHLRHLRYGPDGKDYFWINDMQPRLIMHPYRLDLEGRDVSGFTDPKGKRLFMEFVEMVETRGEGYVDYEWQWKDDPERIVPKLSYVKGFQPWGWIVGTGIYIEDVRSEIAAITRELFLICLGILGLILILSAYIAWQGAGAEKERRRAEEALQKAHDELERRVAERTAELRQTNQALQESLTTLQETRDHLVQSGKMAALGELVAGVAHEINTPVGIGVTAASYLKLKSRQLGELHSAEEMKRSDLEKYLETAREASSSILTNLSRAAGLVKGFKQVAVDQASEELRHFKVREYVDMVLLSLHPKYKRTRHSITVNCQEDLEILSYPGVFSQIITNLVMNSLIHGFEGIEQGRITLDFKLKENALHIGYRDDGRGMSTEEAEKVFNPFFTTKRSQGGSGLGMHVVYNLVTQTLGGQIECRSTPGKGCTYHIIAPLNAGKGKTS